MPDAESSDERIVAPVATRTLAASRRWLHPETTGARPYATFALICGLSSIMFIPAAGPFPLLLAPVAWVLGALDQRKLARDGRPETSTGYAGRLFGVWVTCIFFVAPLTITLLMFMLKFAWDMR